MMKSIVSLLVAAVSVSAFAPVQQPATTTSLQMGLFDGFKPKPKEPEKIGGMDANVFGGRGKKVSTSLLVVGS